MVEYTVLAVMAQCPPRSTARRASTPFSSWYSICFFVAGFHLPRCTLAHEAVWIQKGCPRRKSCFR